MIANFCMRIAKLSGDTVNINNLQIGESINDFVNTTKENEIIVLLVAFQSPTELLFHQIAIDGGLPPILIDGYSLAYV